MFITLKKLLYLLPSGDLVKLVILFFMMLLGALVEVIGVGMIPAFVMIIASPDTVLTIDWLMPVWKTFSITDSGDILVFGAIALIVVTIIKNAYIIFYNYVKALFIYRRFVLIGSNLFNKYMNAPYEFHLKRNTAALLRNVTQEARYLPDGVMTPILKLTMDVVLVVAIIVMLFLVEPLITLGVFLLVGGGGALFMKFIKEKTHELGKIAQNNRGLMIKAVNEGLGGFKDARVLGREAWFNQKFFVYIKRFSISEMYKQVATLANKPIIETIAVSGMLLIALFLYWQGRGLESVIPVLTLFGAATIRIMPAIQGIATEITQLRYYSYAVDPIYFDTVELANDNENFNDFKKEKLVKKEDSQSFEFKTEIRFEDVSYHYPQAEIQAVKNITLSIPKGDVVGFVGASGAGKTTLVDLLLGLLRPQQGLITVDSRDIHSDISSWQRNVGYIPQYIFLTDNTIKRNIAFGMPDEEIKEENLLNAIEAAQLSEFVQQLPDGVNTIIGERGANLSGGQRQRIGIARALYHNPHVLIMDEATSALDNLTEKYLVEAIERLKGERTVLVIAHRLTTVQNCNILYYMDHGRIIDKGQYKDLILRNKTFKKMSLVE